MSRRAQRFTCAAALLIAAFGAGPATAEESLVRVPLGLIEVDRPSDSPITRARIALGRELFFERELSVDRSLSCASCHRPEHGFAEPFAVSRGIGQMARRRNTQSVLNAGYHEVLDWDGRFASLEAQLDGVFQEYGDMGTGLDEAVARLSRQPRYVAMFRDAFGGAPTVDHLRKALATFQRSLVTGDSRFDQFLFARHADALTAQERHGWELFITKAGCITCHDVFHPDVNPLGGGVALFTDHRFHNLGVGYRNGRMEDTGRYEVTRRDEDWGSFRTPGLRDVARTAPYMHDGSLRSLEEVVDFYNKGGIANPNLSAGVQPLFLNALEQAALVALLRALSGSDGAGIVVSRQ